jgi:uncharacterized protein (UPF0548 family)
MTEWRLFHGWSSDELKARMVRLPAAPRSFEESEAEMTGDAGWRHFHSEAVIAPREAEDACFDRARTALANYAFSDPGIVVAHFDPDSPLLLRRFLLEIKVLGLRYLCPAVVNRVRDEPGVFGFRYDTLEGHIEQGVEWFLLTRDDEGRIRFRIEARWRTGEMPNWWSRVGFGVLSGYYQRKWHRQAHRRMSRLARYGSVRPPPPDASGLAHQGVDVEFTYHTKRKWYA